MQNGQKGIGKRIAALGLAIVLCLNGGGMSVLAAGEKTKTESINSAEAATVQLAKTEGNTAVSNASGKEVKLVRKMRLFDGYHIATEEESYAWVELDKAKLVKVDAESEVEVRKKGKLLEVLLDSGNLFST